jgi:hypothetical protein
MMLNFRRIVVSLTGSLLLLGGTAVLPIQASANGIIPPSLDPGAVMMREQQYFRMQQGQPYLFGPVTAEQLRPEAEAEIIYEEGVLPDDRNVQGVIVTPSGTILISPGSQ